MTTDDRFRTPWVVAPAVVILAAAALGPVAATQGTAADGTAALRLEKVGSAQSAFHVLATIVVGPTESIVWDGHYKVSDGQRLAERIAATGTRLKAIVLSHADHDHYMGAMEVVRRFPGTPVYMTQAGLEDFERRSQVDLAAEKRQPNPEAPDELVEPRVLPSLRLQVDGEEIRVIDGLTGDVRGPVSSALWIPSLRALLAADLVFDGIHPWLGDADIDSRAAWRSSLARLAALDPDVVVPGHRRDLSKPDSPEILDAMTRYLTIYDGLMAKAEEPADLERAMQAEYPDLALPQLMMAGARRWFKR